MKTCIECGSRMRPGRVVHRERAGIITLTGSLAALICRNCGDNAVSGPELERWELLASLALVKHGVVTGASFRYMRKALGLRAEDVAKLLDLTTRTITRWEAGETQPDRAALLALASMAEDALARRADTRRILEAMSARRKRGATIVVKAG